MHVREFGAAKRLAVTVRDADAVEHVHEAMSNRDDSGGNAAWSSAAGHSKVSEATRSGWSAAKPCQSVPARPARWARAIPRWSKSSASRCSTGASSGAVEVSMARLPNSASGPEPNTTRDPRNDGEYQECSRRRGLSRLPGEGRD